MKKLLMLTLLALSGCSALTTPADTDLLTGVGVAIIADQPGKSAAERQRQAMETSKLLAYQELAEQVYGVNVSSRRQLSAGKLTAEQTQLRVQGVVKGAKVLRSYQLQGRYVTEVQMARQSLASNDDSDYQLLTLPGPKVRVIRGY